MVVAMFLCPVACDHNDVFWMVSGARTVKLPTWANWCKEMGENLSAGDRIYCFYTLSGSDWGAIQVTFNDMFVEIKGNKMYDKVGDYVGKIRLKNNGDIVIYGGDNIVGINGTYYKD